MNTLLQMILIQVIVVIIIDDSGFVDTMKEKLSRLLTKNKMTTSNFRLRPFDCSYCMQFWANMIYIIITHHFTIPYIAFTLLLSSYTRLTKDILDTIRDLITKVLQKINDL